VITDALTVCPHSTQKLATERLTLQYRPSEQCLESWRRYINTCLIAAPKNDLLLIGICPPYRSAYCNAPAPMFPPSNSFPRLVHY
jgi:hypothetical protein